MTTNSQDSMNVLFQGWGIVEGKLVYVPLYDPPKARKYTAFRDLFASNALLGASQLVSSMEVARKLKTAAKELAGEASKSLVGEWDDGPICPPNWPPIKHHGGHGPDPNPDPIYYPEKMSATVKNALAGDMVRHLGDVTGNKTITELGNEIGR